MDIEKLKTKRQLNVREQNAIEEHRIQYEASYWRKNGIPLGLVKVLNNHNINVDKCIILNYEQDFPGCSTDEGIIVTEDERFIEFEVDLSRDRERVEELYLWDDITDKIEVNASVRGTGATWGYLALKVLSRLNNSEAFENRNLLTSNYISNFMEAFQNVFVLIRANPQAMYNINLLKVFQKYLASVLELSNNDIVMLKKEVNSNINLEDEVRKVLTYRLNMHSNNREAKDTEKISRFVPILIELTQETIALLENQKFSQVHELADAAHNFPEFLITSNWNLGEFWKIYIIPYKKRWDAGFLNKWEEIMNIDTSELNKKTITGLLKGIF